MTDALDKEQMHDVWKGIKLRKRADEIKNFIKKIQKNLEKADQDQAAVFTKYLLKANELLDKITWEWHDLEVPARAETATNGEGAEGAAAEEGTEPPGAPNGTPSPEGEQDDDGPQRLIGEEHATIKGVVQTADGQEVTGPAYVQILTQDGKPIADPKQQDRPLEVALKKGEFTIPAPINTPVVITGRSGKYGPIVPERVPAIKTPGEIVLSRPLKFLGSDKLEIHLQQQLKPMYGQGEPIPVVALATGGEGKYQWIISTQKEGSKGWDVQQEKIGPYIAVGVQLDTGQYTLRTQLQDPTGGVEERVHSLFVGSHNNYQEAHLIFEEEEGLEDYIPDQMLVSVGKQVLDIHRKADQHGKPVGHVQTHVVQGTQKIHVKRPEGFYLEDEQKIHPGENRITLRRRLVPVRLKARDFGTAEPLGGFTAIFVTGSRKWEPKKTDAEGNVELMLPAGVKGEISIHPPEDSRYHVQGVQLIVPKDKQPPIIVSIKGTHIVPDRGEVEDAINRWGADNEEEFEKATENKMLEDLRKGFFIPFFKGNVPKQYVKRFADKQLLTFMQEHYGMSPPVVQALWARTKAGQKYLAYDFVKRWHEQYRVLHIEPTIGVSGAFEKLKKEFRELDWKGHYGVDVEVKDEFLLTLYLERISFKRHRHELTLGTIDALREAGVKDTATLTMEEVPEIMRLLEQKRVIITEEAHDGTK